MSRIKSSQKESTRRDRPSRARHARHAAAEAATEAQKVEKTDAAATADAPAKDEAQVRPANGEKATRRPRRPKLTQLGIKDELDAAKTGAKERADGTARSLIPKGKRVVVALVVIAFAFVFVYGPLRNLYIAKRDALRLEAQYEALNETNEGIEGDIGALQSREGIEDEARRRGYVEEGEVSINVEGLDVEDDSATTSQVDSTYGANAYEAPWYIEILDIIFLYGGK